MAAQCRSGDHGSHDRGSGEHRDGGGSLCDAHDDGDQPAEKDQVEAVALGEDLHGVADSGAAQGRAESTAGARDEDDHARRLEGRSDHFLEFAESESALASEHDHGDEGADEEGDVLVADEINPGAERDESLVAAEKGNHAGGPGVAVG